ncbi:hypothetical protein F5Y15DRAFT_392606 [Xylariaceae sp. FL0016]|nr:hypothetical protein F5Y15DRAFT_392606 [Xylariaceae sp. FL0016]
MANRGPLQWNPGISPRTPGLKALGKETSTVADYFLTTPRFEYVKHYGEGRGNGGVILVNRFDPQSSLFLRQFTVKDFPSADNLIITARREFEMLKMLRGAAHIVQLVGDGNAVIYRRLVIIMEFVGHGTMREMLERFESAN